MSKAGYGRVVVIASSVGLVGSPNVGHYVAAKHGVIGLTKSLALEEAANGISVNCVCPTTVRTAMLENEAVYGLMSPQNPTRDAALDVMQSLNPIPVAWMEPEDVAGVVLFLASDETRYMTGGEIKVDMGLTAG
jgi:NAD(P)-dependent dehydrogenase (short-subunit alcohol dehydrogenase family)